MKKMLFAFMLLSINMIFTSDARQGSGYIKEDVRRRAGLHPIRSSDGWRQVPTHMVPSAVEDGCTAVFVFINDALPGSYRVPYSHAQVIAHQDDDAE